MIRAVLGGSFDPVHSGHLALGAHLLEAGLAEQVMVIPAAQSPHKNSSFADSDDRLAMCRLAFADLEGAVVDDREIRRGGTSFTVDTLDELQTAHPGDELILAIGADNLGGFAAWRDPDRIIRLARVALYPREGIPAAGSACTAAGIPLERAILVDGFDHPVSSTSVRAILSQGRVPDLQLPAAVADFIRSRHLYGV